MLIVYASLYPFEGWRVPAGVTLWQMLTLPWPPWRVRFDEVSNLLGYVPLGVLACYCAYRWHPHPRRAWLAGVVLATAASYGIEVMQGFLPSRVPSLKDTAFNSLGAAIGGSLVVVLLQSGMLRRAQAVRRDWFGQHEAVALTLLLLWPMALLYPAPVPLGLGEGWTTLAPWAADVFGGTPLQAWFESWFVQAPVSGGPSLAITPEHEMLIVGLGLLVPCLLAYSTIALAVRRTLLTLGALGLAVGVSTLSVALTFSPEHALAWITPNVLIGLCTGTLFALLCIAVPPRAAAWLGLLALAWLVSAVSTAPADPYYAALLSTWEQGAFIRFHGVSQWVGKLWPFAVLLWFLARGLRRHEDGA